MNSFESAETLSVEQRIQHIAKVIRAEEKRLREKYSFLKYQDWIGFTVMLFSLAGMVGCAYLYYIDVMPAWLCIICAAIFASVSHELEHDLIHRQYFSRNAFMQNLMMLVVWIMRPNTVNPWYRRGMHFLHHRVSGTKKDLEERLVGNGIRYGFMRFVVMFDGLVGMLARRTALKNDIENFSVMEVLNAAFPLALLYFSCWYVFLGFHGYDAIWGAETVYPLYLLDAMSFVDFMVVVLIAPNFIRSGSLNFVTSAMHYYGGVNNLIQQTQILKPWFLAPMHLFCFNFGSTHAIHHFVVGQPFYIRQMVAKVAHRVMKEHGVRYNDFSTFFSANRYHPH
ncbi:MAG: fatty acid desaturase [Spongiibacteraceae bacterium]